PTRRGRFAAWPTSPLRGEAKLQVPSPPLGGAATRPRRPPHCVGRRELAPTSLQLRIPDLPTRWGGELLLFRFFFAVGGGFGTAFGFADQSPPLADAGLLANLASQVVEAALTHVAVAQHVDLVDARRMDQEGALDPDAMRDT